MEPVSPTKNERDIRYANMKLMRQQILDIRERKNNIPKVPEPEIVRSFDELYRLKSNQIKKKILEKRLQLKKKQVIKTKGQLLKYQQIYHEKDKSFKEKQQLLRVLEDKLNLEYERTKNQFKEVGFTRSISTGVRKLNYYRLGEILFNQNARRVFSSLENYVQSPMKGQNSQNKSQEEVGICLGYLGLLITIVGKICEARLWIDFTFRGSKSMVRLGDGTNVVLRPRETRFSQGINALVEQLYQIMSFNMGLKVQKLNNLYQMCEELSVVLLQ